MDFNIEDVYFIKDKLKNIRFWSIVDTDEGFMTKTGIIKSTGDIADYKEYNTPVRGNQVRNSKQQIVYEIKSKIDHKYNSGYRSISDIGGRISKSNSTIVDNRGVNYTYYNFLKTYLPDIATDNHGYLKPMLARPYKESRKKNEFPRFIQPKINGIRCMILWDAYIEGEGMFAKTVEGPILLSREGKRYRVPDIEFAFNNKNLFISGEDQMIVYDGELYIHEASLNYIRSCVPMYNDKGTLSNASGNTSLIEYWAFDIAMIAPQQKRISLLESKLRPLSLNFKKVKVVPTTVVHNHTDVVMNANHYIDNGYEGAILRNITDIYKYGERGATMEKVKKYKDTECIIINIIPKPKERDTALFILMNDYNDEIFECNPMGTYRERQEYLENKDEYIGKKATVRFRERSGIKKVPFHANVVTVRNYE